MRDPQDIMIEVINKMAKTIHKNPKNFSSIDKKKRLILINFIDLWLIHLDVLNREDKEIIRAECFFHFLLYFKNSEELVKNPHLNKFDQELLRNTITKFYKMLLHFNNDNGDIYLNDKDQENSEFLKYFHIKDLYKLIKKERKKTVDRVNQSKLKGKEKSKISFFTKIKSFFSFDFSRNNSIDINRSNSSKRQNDSFECIQDK